MFSFHSGNENEISQKDRPRPIQRTLSMSSDKSVLGVKQWILRIVHCNKNKNIMTCTKGAGAWTIDPL